MDETFIDAEVFGDAPGGVDAVHTVALDDPTIAGSMPM
jgi:hypothetical protein